MIYFLHSLKILLFQPVAWIFFITVIGMSTLLIKWAEGDFRRGKNATMSTRRKAELQYEILQRQNEK
jgi:hypothetical protein